MASDEAVFEAVRLGQCVYPVVHVYAWDRPAVSFGRLQDIGTVRAAFPDVPLVRRPTGGRAVLHGDDLTISVVTRTEWLPVRGERGVLSSYRQIVAGILDAFQSVGMDVSLGGDSPKRALDNVDCFASAAACDAVDARTGRKIMGSAQRRQDGAILQQMSILRTFVPDPAAFIAFARAGLGRALGVTEWLFVDTRQAV